MIYRGEGEEVDILVCEATEDDNGSDIIYFDGSIVSPTAPVQIFVYDSEESHAKIINAIYGCLPNRMLVVAVPNGFLDLAAGLTPEYPGVKMIFQPFSIYDPHIVEDVILQPFEDDDEDGNTKSEISDNDLGRIK